ncbi:MAG: deoxyhypusine synthase [Nanoarchaeota archaeon]
MNKPKKTKPEEAAEAILKESEEIKGKSVKGYDFNHGVDYKKIIDSFSTTGFQAVHLSKAIDIIRKMREEKVFIYLGYTSNIVSSGMREIIRYLVEHKLVDILVTTGGGIEEDIIKCLGDFKISNFSLSGEMLREKGINRIGNILVPNSRYIAFENFVLPILEKYKDQTLNPSTLIHILGKEINNKDSIYYWAQKNNIFVHCPAIMDGSLGDMIYFFKNKHPEFKIEVSEDTIELNNSTLGKNKTGMIILGAGIIKHSICNANLYRNGADYAVFFNNAIEEDGSDAGARPDEAVSWGKIKTKGESIKVFGDITINFPLVVARSFFD